MCVCVLLGWSQSIQVSGGCCRFQERCYADHNKRRYAITINPVARLVGCFLPACTHTQVEDSRKRTDERQRVMYMYVFER